MLDFMGMIGTGVLAVDGAAGDAATAHPGGGDSVGQTIGANGPSEPAIVVITQPQQPPPVPR